MKEVQAFIDNIMFPKTLEELELLMQERGRFNVEEVFDSETVEWTSPKWCRIDDIVFFMHGKTVNAHISRLRRQLNEGQHSFSPADCAELLDFLNRGKALYDRYGGKIFVIGRVLGTPFCEDDEDFYDTSTQDLRHWNSNIYAEIGDLFCLP